MAISSSVSSLGLKPGVCTSTTRPTAPYEGQMIYETDTNRVLIWDNAAWVMIADTDTPPGLELVKTQTVGTGLTSIPVSSVFSSDYSNYKVIIDIESSNGTASHLFQFNATTTSNYLVAGYYQSWGGAGMTAYSPAFSTTWVLSANNLANVQCSIVMDIINPNRAIRSSAVINSMSANGMYSANALENTTNQSTGFTITKAGDTMTGGTIRVYGYRN